MGQITNPLPERNFGRAELYRLIDIYVRNIYPPVFLFFFKSSVFMESNLKLCRKIISEYSSLKHFFLLIQMALKETKDIPLENRVVETRQFDLFD